ncbi:kinesin-like protein KIF16B isoform X2 [Dendronephthya gigantea]|uniref:kinesin-like protein KIF16B isoform X2 n=1 Tax=Dendronephthya gigantea TaxID=151771 RepID=UPI00106AB494|nr:kinesin-like protein KIF16B isoform X2 [Dendronephthya gigantea]
MELYNMENELNAKCIIKMENNKTTIFGSHGEDEKKDFTFDFSYWSFNSRDRHFATQERVFKDLGIDVLNSAFEGYNACIFAYGQTGAGKSYSMMGCEGAEGLIPRICEGLYSRMGEDNNGKTEFKTEVSYLEIYNEKVRDLLRPAKGKDQYNLKVREHPKEGPYVQDLTKHLVGDYNGIESLMNTGNSHRVTAATNMNDTSSRSHAIFTLVFTQAKFDTDMPSETVSKIHLVDLAGSERASSTGATGERLKEGANINKSLVTLGTVISALAEQSEKASSGGGGKDSKKKIFIPYRNSVLTWLLKDSLGGNAKTIMIAAISPADVNYAETLSTLRYANRAKNIVNKPTVNEDANVRLIRELRAEIESLKAMLKKQGTADGIPGIGQAEETRMTERLHENEAKAEELTRNWTSKWKESHKIIEERALGFRYEGAGVKMESELPHLVCIDDDILSTGITMYHLTDGRTYVGKEEAKEKQDIILNGPGIDAEHCILESIEGHVTVHPLSALCFVNGEVLDQQRRLKQGDVLLLGKTNTFRYNHPGEAAKLRKKRMFQSMDNLSSETDEVEKKPSYLLYNASLELERQYMEETKRIEEQRTEMERQQREAAERLERARQDVEILQEQQRQAEELKLAEEEKRHLQLERRKTEIEEEKKLIEELKQEQEETKRQAKRELETIRANIAEQQDEEKKKLDAEMDRLALLKEQHDLNVASKEQEIQKMKDELMKKWEEEKKEVEKQREQIEVLRKEIEEKEEAVKRASSPERNRNGSSSTSLATSDESNSASPEISESSSSQLEAKSHVEVLRNKLKQLDLELQRHRVLAKGEITAAKDAVRRVEQETLQGMRSLATGKTDIEVAWKKLDTIQTKHKVIEEDLLLRINEIREKLEKAEDVEEADLLEKERVIMERRAARMKVEEARRQIEELESESRTLDLGEADFNKKKEMLEGEAKEEIKDIREEKKILLELLSKHQVALSKASHMVTETKVKLENCLENERITIEPQRERVELLVRNELGPLIEMEGNIERRCEDLDRDNRERKKNIYKQRRRIALLERQHNQALQQAEKDTLNKDELEELENEREAEKSLIRKEKLRLLDMEKRHKEQQEIAELTIGESVEELEKRKARVNAILTQERSKLGEMESVHKETLDFIERELEERSGILQRVKEKVGKDKRTLAKLDARQQRVAAKAAEELFMMAEILEKEMTAKGKFDELAKIKEHRKRLQDLDKQLKMAERKEKNARLGVGDDNNQQCVLL